MFIPGGLFLDVYAERERWAHLLVSDAKTRAVSGPRAGVLVPIPAFALFAAQLSGAPRFD